MKAISFDLWGTLIKSHPEFKKNRDTYFQSLWCPEDLHLFQVSERIKAVEKECDLIGEITGDTVSSHIQVAMILKTLGNDLKHYLPSYFHDIEKNLMELALQYPPQYYDSDTVPTLEWLKEEGYTVVTASNTGLLSGITMRWVLNKIKLDKLVKAQVYSDVVRYSKPNINFFESVDKALGTKDYLHVGDNINADGGANKPFIINTNGLTILDLKKHLETNPQKFLSESFH